jgi:hypothetical protein
LERQNDEWTSAPDLPERKRKLAQYARNTLRKDRRLNIRIFERELLELQKCVNGTLVEADR